MPTPTVGQTVTYNPDGEMSPSPGTECGDVLLVAAGRVLLGDVRDTNPVVIGPPVNVNTGSRRRGRSIPTDIALETIVSII